LEFRVPVGKIIFSSPRRPDRFWGPPSLLPNGYRGLSPGVKLQGREADHSPQTNAEVKKKVTLYIHSLGKPRRRWVDNIKMDLKDIGLDGMDWIEQAQDRDQCRALVNTVMNLRVH
jgi:hypothetical protein